MRKLEDLTGKKFNRWTVIGLNRIEVGRRIWECRCECGAIKYHSTSLITLGIVKSCGCLQKETMRVMISKREKAPKKPPEYHIWYGIVDRCNNKNNVNYHRYGGIGITVCKRWAKSFYNFYKDMGQRPSDSHTIDRKNNNKGYTKSNCRWATPKEQANNRRSNRYFKYNGERLTMQEVIEKIGIHKSTFKSRLKRGWSLEMIVSIPVKHKPK